MRCRHVDITPINRAQVAVGCSNEAVMGIISTPDDESLNCAYTLNIWPSCADHAAEDVHEARQCTSCDEIEVVAFAVPAVAP